MKRNHLLLTLLLAIMVPWAAMGRTQNMFFSDDFEGSSCEWNLINGTQTNQWVWGTATNNTEGGSKALYISNDDGGSNAYTNSLYSIVYATRHLAFGTGEYTIEYDWKAYGESNYDYLRAWLAPENTELTAGQLPNGNGASGISSYINTTPEGWVPLDGGGKLNLSDAWQSQSSTVNVEAGNYMLVFMWANDGSVGTNPPAAIDNVSIVSNCAIIPTASLPYVEDFDSYPYYSANDLPICWSYINTSTGSHTYPQMESGSSHNSSANALSLYSYSYCNESTIFVNDPQPQYAILPEIQDVSRLKMTLWARARSMDNSATVTYDATFKVGVMTDPTDASTFVQIGDPLTPQSTTYEQYTISFDNYTGNGTYIAIMIDAASTISDQPQASHDYHRWVCIDDITVELKCDAPTNLTIGEVTTEYVSFTFDSEIGGVYQYCILEEGIDPADYPQLFEGNTGTAPGTEYYGGYPLNGFDLNTDYVVYVRKKCGENVYSAMSTATFRTLDQCAAIPSLSFYYSPYSWSFEDVEGINLGDDPTENNLPTCWDYINTSSDETMKYYPVISYSSQNNFLFFSSMYAVGGCVDPQPQYAVLPPVEDVSILKMSFRAKTITYFRGTFSVGVMEGMDASTFEEIVSFDASTSFQDYTVTFENYTGTGKRIAIMGVAADDSHRRTAVSIDDIVLELNCDAPSNLAVNNITFTSADLSWTGSPADESYTVRYRTAPVYGTPAFSEGFENGLDYWEFHSGNEINGLNGDEGVHAGISDYTAHSRRYSFRFSSFRPIGEGETKQQSLYSPVFSLDAPNVFSFYCRNQMSDDNGYEILRIDYSSTDETIHTLATIYPSFEWQSYSFEIPADAKQVRFEYLDGMRFVYIDDITVSKMVASYGEWQYVNDIAVTSTTLSGLTLGTDYEAQVAGSCNNDEWSNTVSFATQGCTYPVLSTWDFEDATPGQLPQCWTRMGSSPTKPLVHNIYHFSGTQYLEFYHASPDDATLIAVMPAIDADLNTLRVEFYGKQTYGNDPAFIQVGYVTDLNDPESYGHAKTFYMTDTPAKYTAFFNNAPTDGYIVFKTSYLNQNFAIVIDDVSVKELGCEAVTNLQVTETGSNSITLDWDGQDDAEFYIYYLNQTTQESMRTPGTVRPPYTLEDLTSNTSYTIRVTAECNVVNSNPYDQSLVATMDVRTNFCPAPTDITVTPIDATSVDVSWTGSSEAASYTLSYRTMAIAGDNPIHTQGFEDGMGDWFIGNESIGYPTYAGICTEAAHSGDHSFKLTGFIEEGNAREALLFGMSQITEPSVLRFYYKRNAASSDVFLVFSFYSEYYGQQWWPLNPTEDWQLFTMDLPDDVVGIEFDYYGPGLNSDAGVYIDDITISPVAQAAGEMQTVDNITDTNHTLTGLVEDTDYELYVYSDCSMAASPVFFSTTPCFAPTDVEVSDILHTSATVTWTSESENYTMSYREAERPEILHEEDFNSNSIPSDWSTYTGLLSDVMEGTAQLVVNNATNYTNWRMANTTIFGAYSACCNIYATTNKWLVTPEFTFNTSGSLSFDLAQTRYNNSSAPTGDCTDDRFVVLIFSDDQWTILREWNNTGSAYVFNDITNTRQTISDIDLSAYVGKTVKIAFYGESTESNGDNDMHIDNVVINVMVPATPWQTIPDIAATTYDLTNLTAGTEYEVKVQAACGEESEVVSFATLSNDHKIFVTEGYWNNDSNWIPYGAPTIDQDVELRADVTIPNGYLATANQIEETWEHGITIEDGGQLYHTNYLLATVKKHVGGYGQENQGTNNGYILLAQPIQYTVSVEPNDESNIRTGVYDFYAWSRLGDNEGKEWINYGASNTSGLPMDEGNGYLYASQEDRELTFLANIRGNADAYPINNMEYTVPTSGAMFTAWNLIGNSFACNVYLTNARTNGSALPFYKMNAEGNGFEAAIGTTIAPMEGVFYEKPASTTSYQPWFTRTQPTRSSNINISLAQGSTTATIDNAIIRFDDGETMGKLSFREGSSKVYIPVEGKDLAVAQAEGQVGEFPVNFKAEEDGTYTLSFTSEEVEFSYLHLIDNLIGNDVDLLSQDVISTEGKKSPSYTFTAKTTDGENRFKLVFATDGSQVDHLAFEAKDAGGLRSAALTPHVPEHQQTENQDADLFVQAISLVQGWNWWAPMAKISAAQLRTVLGSALLELKAKEGDVAADADLMPGKMYKLQTNADVESVVNGVVAPASNISEPGVYWIGYTGETSSSITQALVSVNIFPNAGDKIISQDGGFAIFVYPGWTWQGTLTELRHGQGYVYIHVAQ